MSFVADPNDFTTPGMTSSSLPSPWLIKDKWGLAVPTHALFSNSDTEQTMEYHATVDRYCGCTLDTGGSYAVGSVKITVGTIDVWLVNSPTEIEIYGSNSIVGDALDFRDKWGDPAYSDEWTLLINESGQTSWTSEETRTFTSLDTLSEFRYFCVKFRKGGGTGYWRLMEVELIEANPVITTAFDKTYNSIIRLSGGSYETTAVDKTYNSLIRMNGSNYTAIDKTYNSLIRVYGGDYTPIDDTYNSYLKLTGNIYLQLPVTFSVMEHLFIGIGVKILPFTLEDGLPFSGVGGEI